MIHKPTSIFSIKTTFKKELLLFSIPLMISGSLSILMNNFDTFMIGYFLNSASVGIYNIAYGISVIMLIPLSLFGYIYFPLSSKLLKEDKNRQIKRLLPLVNKWGTMSVLPLIFIFLAYPTQIISLLFGTEYTGANQALQILTLGYIPHLLNGKTGETLKSGGFTQIILFAAIIATLVNISLNFLLIPKIGVNGAAIATGISFFTLGLIYIFALFNVMKMSPFSRNYLTQLVFAGGIGVFLINLNEILGTINLGLTIFLVLNIILFYFFLVTINVITRKFEEEDKILIKILKEKLRI